MKPLLLTTAFLSFATAAMAGADIRDVDVNGNRFITYSELMQSAPGLTRTSFGAMDQNGDRRLSATEFAGARAQAIVSQQTARPATDPSGGLSLAPASVARIDSDQDGRVSFDELLRLDVPSQVLLRGN
ncbi:MAG: EF-hand domain-containing protein [Silicimonas sp.]|nr:EF-hand domain-containing protein [Silicimonas sp.]